MDNYTIYCTEEQTKKALELGAPIDTEAFANDSRPHTTASNPKRHDFIVNCVIPTAEQMLGWLEKQGLDFYITTRGCSVVSYSDYGCIFEEHDVDRKTSTLKAINAALDYLADNNLIK